MPISILPPVDNPPRQTKMALTRQEPIPRRCPMADDFRKPVEELYVSATGVSAVEMDWSEGYGETWDVVFPDTDSLTVEECREIIIDVCSKDDLPDPNPWGMDRDDLFQLLVDNNLAEDFTAEPEEDDGPALREDVTKEELLARVVEAINDEEID